MKVVLLSEFYCHGMGYLENMLPKYFARLGVETHVVATCLEPHTGPRSKPYDGFLPGSRPGTSERFDGYVVHRVGHKTLMGRIRMRGLKSLLRQIRPHIVQTMSVTGWIPIDAALNKSVLNYKLFTGCHHHASVFPLASKERRGWGFDSLICVLTRGLPGKLLSRRAEKCYAISPDCADIAVRFFGVPEDLVEICPLGVDTEIFYPISSDQDQAVRTSLRQKFGFKSTDTVCIYTGRFSDDKNPLLLAKAIDQLARSGTQIRGLFVGNGTQAHEIQECTGCVVHPFVNVTDLGRLYRAAEIGVWPRQESLSMLDAAACGIPIVVNDRMAAKERIEGNGIEFGFDDLSDLVRVLLTLSDSVKRRDMGEIGAERMRDMFSWETIARRRLQDYVSVLGSKELESDRSGHGALRDVLPVKDL